MAMFNSYVSLPEGTYGKSPNLFLKQVNQWSQCAIFNSYVKLEGNIAFICFTGFDCQIFLIETGWSDNDIVSLCGGETTRQNGVAGHVAPFFAVMHRADVVHGDTWHGGYSSLTWKTVRPPTKRWYKMIHAIHFDHVAFVAKSHGYFKSCGGTCLWSSFNLVQDPPRHRDSTSRNPTWTSLESWLGFGE